MFQTITKNIVFFQVAILARVKEKITPEEF